MILQILLAIVLICGSVSAQPPAPTPVAGVNLHATLFTIPAAEAARLGLAGDPAQPNVGSVLSPEELQKLAAQLREIQGFEMFNAPHQDCAEREPVVVEQVREFRHSTAFEGSAPADEKAGDDASLFLPRLRPTKFETRNVGITVRMVPTFSPAGLIDLQVDTVLVNLAGWVGYHQGKTAASDANGFPAEGFQMPVFATTHSSSSLVLQPSHTALIGGFPVLEHIALERRTTVPQVEKLRFIAITATTNSP